MTDAQTMYVTALLAHCIWATVAVLVLAVIGGFLYVEFLTITTVHREGDFNCTCSAPECVKRRQIIRYDR